LVTHKPVCYKVSQSIDFPALCNTNKYCKIPLSTSLKIKAAAQIRSGIARRYAQSIAIVILSVRLSHW